MKNLSVKLSAFGLLLIILNACNNGNSNQQNSASSSIVTKKFDIGISQNNQSQKINALTTAGIYLNFENNCESPQTFKLTNKLLNVANYVVQPNQYTNQFVSAGKLSTQSTDKYQVTTQDSSILFTLADGYTSNSILFSAINGLGTNWLTNDTLFSWHGVPVIGSFVGTPTATINACPNKTLDVEKSVLFTNTKRVVILGDSLSDDGNLIRADGGILPKSTPYYNGMFSNGNTWSMMLKQALDVHHISVSNYAVGGAVSVFHLQEKLPYSLGGEYQAYTLNASSLPEFVDQRLVIILIGANDYLGLPGNMSNNEMETKTSNVIDNGIRAATTKLLDSGIKKIVFIDLPDLGKTPECSQDNNCATLSAIISMHNRKLASLVNSLQHKYTTSIFKLVTLSSIFNLAINDTNSFNSLYQTNINDVIQPCWTGNYTKNPLLNTNSMKAKFNQQEYNLPNNVDIQEAAIVGNSDGSACLNPENHLFWDHVHPTHQIHKAFFMYFINQLKTTI